ncbi:MAG: DNA translocase FtsK [Oscillospiraceae bacterium]|nr:DNA translocase FtsK [Oscillospiraceae bacterium]
MAQATKKTAARQTAAKKKTPAKTAASSRKPAVSKGTPSGSPAGRAVGAMACLFLGLFSFIGYFDVDAWFITYFCGFIKGISGWGYYIFPPALIICSVNLLIRKNKPVGFRVVSTLMLPLFLGAIYHLFSKSAEIEFSKSIISVLYKSGQEMTSGGVLSGLLAMGMKSAVSIYGAAPVFTVGIIFFGMNSVGLTVPKLIESYRSRSQYEPVPEKAQSTAAIPAANARSDEKTFAMTGKKRIKAIDIPLDEASLKNEDYTEEKVGFFNTKPRVKTPDQVLSQDSVKPSPVSTKTIRHTPEPTENVKPLSVEEAAVVAGVTQLSSEGAGATAAIKKVSRDEVDAETEEITKTIEKTMEESAEIYRYPPVSLLSSAGQRNSIDGREEISLNRERLESTIRSFGVSGAITGITRGPTVTRYDLELEQGVKLAKLTNLAGDLALSLGVTSVRIAPIPDKISTVGIEVPNKLVSMVYLHDIINSQSFKTAQSRLSFAIGEDIGGNAIVGNIAKLPHLLIAGTTGSGKSVCMNSLIISLLYKSTPEEVRLIMIDPKMVELGVYNGIPHLFVPVVTDPKKAAGALQWAVVEMLKRYRLFSENGVRDLTGYNAHQKSIREQTLPRVVIVIDELADLMLVASKEVEESICRVAQMGRAAGMHLVIATQRPSADVITGLMKANIPSRIAFAVSSAMESRIILDSSGAEKLIGAGDMLYSPLGVGKPMRVQGAFVTDEEREKIISFVKEGTQVVYSEDILAQIEKAAENKNGASAENDRQDAADAGSDYDELLPQAVEVIFETKQASVSMLQRRLKLGYARAARIVDQMEEIGVVGPFEGSKPRQVLVTKQQWQEMQSSQGGALRGPASDQVSFSEYADAPSDDWKD